MTRRITPLRDLASLCRIYLALRRIHPEIVHAHTPKGGLLGMMAAWLARTPVRVYHLRGLPLLTATGARRWLLRFTEWTSCALAHRVFAVSHSMRTIALEEGLCGGDKITVLASGSGNGVDATGRFKPLDQAVRLSARAEHRIPADALVIGFVGRLVRDKGVVELASAWRQLREGNPRLHLLLVGPFEPDDPLPLDVVAGLESDPRVHLTGLDRDIPRLYAAMDVVALPTYREGFPNVALEAAAMELPVVATAVPGCIDAVHDGVTGTLVPSGDALALAQALQQYLSDAPLRAKHREAARRRVLAEFRREAIWQAIAEEYRTLLELASAPEPPATSRLHSKRSHGRRIG
jgi:glycosyltransferase involved in cell wall biosynthesis